MLTCFVCFSIFREFWLLFTAYLGGWGAGLASGCIVVCSKNYVYDGKICQPCATLFASQIDLKYYSFWNASDSTRWWPAESDSLFGMTTRRTSGLEHRVSIQTMQKWGKHG